MNMIKVRKQCFLRGRDQSDLEQQLLRFRKAITAHSGAIVDIKQHLQGPAAVSIVYQLPLHCAHLDPMGDAA